MLAKSSFHLSVNSLFHSTVIKTLVILALSVAPLLLPGRASASGQVFWTGTDLFGGFDQAVNAVIALPDGRFLIGGTHRPISNLDIHSFAIDRLKPNGDRDSATWNSPYSSVNSCACYSAITALALQPDSKVLAGGYTAPFSGGPWVIAFARYNDNGTLDATFGRDGQLITGIEGNLNSLVIMPDGKILAGGSSQGQFALFRFYSDGTLDTDFGVKGVVRTPLLGGSGSIVSLLQQPDGKLIAGGNNDPGDGSRFAVARYNPDGSLDNTFGQGGFTTIVFSKRSDTSYGTDIAPDGKIVTGGCANGFKQVAIARLQTDGTLDTSFDGDGKIVTSIGGNGTRDGGCATGGVKAQRNGKVVAAGFSRNGAATKIAVMRFYRNGTSDRSFHSDGLLLYPDFINSVRPVTHTTILSNGNVVAATGLLGSIGSDTGPSLLVIGGDHSSAISDFDADAAADLSVFRPSTSEWWHFDSSDGNDVTVQFGTPGSVLVPADYTGDFKTDIAEWIPSTGEWRILRSDNSGFISGVFGRPGDIPTPGDYDNDGKADLAVFRPSNGFWYILNSSNGGFRFEHFGDQYCVPVARDYDADGVTDIAVFRRNEANGTGEWWVTRSAFPQVTSIMNFGGNTDVPVPADYDGDGVTDVAVWRPSDGLWLVFTWQDSGYYGFNFGSAGDIPAPGDYDGDGKADAVVFRPSEGGWYIQNSTEGFSNPLYGTNGDRPIASAYIP